MKAITTLGNGTDPGNASLAPGGVATMADAFTLLEHDLVLWFDAASQRWRAWV